MSELISNKDENVLSEILGAARNLFKKQGLKKTTMDDIASRIGKCKGALYYYFASKDEIFEAVVQQEMTELFSHVNTETNEASGAKNKLIAYCRTRLEKLSGLFNLSAVLKREVADFTGRLENVRKKFDTTQVAVVADIIRSGINNGEFRKMEKEYIASIACLIVSAFKGLDVPLYVDNHAASFGKKAEFIVNMMVDGMGCRPVSLPETIVFN